MSTDISSSKAQIKVLRTMPPNLWGNLKLSLYIFCLELLVAVMDRFYATTHQHEQLSHHICWLLRARRYPLSTSTRLSLIDMLLEIRPSPENSMNRLDLRTFHLVRRVLTELSRDLEVAERHYLQDIIRWAVDCHRERVFARIRQLGVGNGNGMSRESQRCHRCHQYGERFPIP